MPACVATISIKINYSGVLKTAISRVESSDEIMIHINLSPLSCP